METLSIKECQQCLLGIAKELDRICTKHDITYYMISGTLLGAIRHKGFIPWDDDMDFAVPINEYDKLLCVLKKELKPPYRLCTYEEMKGCNTAFAKIDDYTTCIEDKCSDIPLKEQLGLNIDIFPLFPCDKNDPKIRKMQYLRKLNRLVFTESTKGGWHKHIIKKLLRLLYPHSRSYLLDRIWGISKSITGGEYLGHLFGLNVEKEILPQSWYGKGPRYAFEDTTFRGPEKYEEYLTQIYGRYMILPPVEKRKSHSSNTYNRNSILQV